MIEKMKVVHIVAAASEKTALLDRLRTLGIVHFPGVLIAVFLRQLCAAVPDGHGPAGVRRPGPGDRAHVRQGL